jgi:hypothetical protein
VSPIDLAEQLFGPEPDQSGPILPRARLPEPNWRLYRQHDRRTCGCAALGSNGRADPAVRGLFSIKPGM